MIKEKRSDDTPIYIGITGHRDLEIEQNIIENIKKILNQLENQYPKALMVLLTPLADGADRAAAKAVLEMNRANIKYSVILPMDEALYLKTFQNDKSVSEYNSLKRYALQCEQIPIEGGVDQSLYVNLGAYIALNTQILIAVWNGEEVMDLQNFKPGGTYHVIRMRLFGVEGSNKSEVGPIYWIKAKRRSSDWLAGGPSIVGPIFSALDGSDASNKKVLEYLSNKE